MEDGDPLPPEGGVPAAAAASMVLRDSCVCLLFVLVFVWWMVCLLSMVDNGDDDRGTMVSVSLLLLRLVETEIPWVVGLVVKAFTPA